MALAIRRTASVASYSASYLDHLDSYQYEALCPGVPLVIDLHNVYSTLVHRTGTESRRPYSWYLHREAQLLAQVERRAVNRASLVLAVSDQDAKHFRSLGAKNVCVVPNGVDCQLYERLPIAAANAAPVILFVGAMSWPPNVSAARFLARDAFPAIVKQFPAARLRIIGRDPTPEVVNLARLPGVEVLGRVADMVPHLEHAHILAVPLEAGGGTRLKILEAFAAGIPVVSTAVGLEGIAAEPDREVMVSERATFAETIVELLRDPDRASRMGTAARELARRRYDWSVVGRILCDAVAAVIDRVPAAMYG
jgi:glycosyltransferase involved in cell wall biosynthesis